MSSGRYMAYSPSPSTAPQSPHILPALRSASSSSASALSDEEKYIAELFAERQKLSPFQNVLPNCWRLLNQEIFRVTTLLGNAQILDQSGLEHARPLASGGMYSNGRADVNGWNSPYRSEMSGLSHHSSPQSWLGSHGLVVKKSMRVDVPVDKYPNYNFVGRLLGPRGNSLKRVEASTNCRVLIRGRGSIKDPAKEEMMRGKPGYEHLNEPLHIFVEAELLVDVIDAHLFQARQILEDLLKPVVTTLPLSFSFPSCSVMTHLGLSASQFSVTSGRLIMARIGGEILIVKDESQDFFKKQQLRELAMINGTLRDEGAHMSGSVSPFHNSLGMKRAKTQG
ncbi:KH domain-containing protein [Drosera capensis]